MGVHRCAQCGKAYDNRAILDSHIALRHSENAVGSKGEFACTQCDKKYETQALLERHTTIRHTQAAAGDAAPSGPVDLLDSITTPNLAKNRKMVTVCMIGLAIFVLATMVMIVSDVTLFATILVAIIAGLLLLITPMLAVGMRGATFYPSANCVAINVGYFNVRLFDFSSDQLDLANSPVFVEVRGEQVGGGRGVVHESYLLLSTPQGELYQIPVERTKRMTPARWSKELEAQLNEIHVVLHRKTVTDRGDIATAAGDIGVVVGACFCV
jgi:hypothetical protein